MRIRDFRRQFIYHSPSYPGYTSWCGLWAMPDGDLMCSFTQATGPFAGRPKAPMDVRNTLSWPPGFDAAPDEKLEAYDMTGLTLENVHLRSRDLGLTWEIAGTDAFRSCMNGVTGEAEVAGRDGTLLRGVLGPYLPYDDVPRTGYLERSSDGGRAWEFAGLFYARDGYRFWPKRLRYLADGRLLAGGGLMRIPDSADAGAGWFREITPVLIASEDDGRTWGEPLDVLGDINAQAKQGITEEFDWAELPDGDLLCIHRADGAPAGMQRQQSRLRKDANTWRTTSVDPAPFPHSGHPELVATRAGVVLHVATTGISATDDGGSTWQHLVADDGLDALRQEPATPYYPKAVELPTGEILVIGHVGGDNGYGHVDQSILGVRFFLEMGAS